MVQISGEFLKKRLSELNIQKQDFANMMNIGPSAVSNWLSRGVPSGKEEETLKVLKLDSIETQENIPVCTIDNQNIKIPKLRNITVSAGCGFDANSVDKITYDGTLTIDTKDIIISEKKVSSLIAIRVDGRSMSPTLNHNEWVVINKDKKEYIGDNLYVVNYAGNLLVKRLQYDPSINSVEIISDNPSYKNYKVSLSEDQQYFQIVGLVVSVLTGC